MIASTCLYLAGKIKDEQIKVRDIINVSRNTLHRNTLPLDLKEEYWSMRDAIVQGELLVMRMLKFEVTITHPHKVTKRRWVIVESTHFKVPQAQNCCLKTCLFIFIFSLCGRNDEDNIFISFTGAHFIMNYKLY